MIFLVFPISLSILCENALPYQMYCQPVICNIDEMVSVNCTVFHSTICTGNRSFSKIVSCRYCYQLPNINIECDPLQNCVPSISVFTTECRAKVHCIGNSIFHQRSVCKNSSKSQIIAFFLSIFLGGLAIDRFYLGYYIFGAFKLLTLGGFGIAYIFDIILILIGYLGPADGALYPERL